MHSVMFPLIKDMYDQHFSGYTTDGIKVFVRTGYITESEYQKITGVPYTP